MKDRDQKLYLQDIATCIDKIQGYTHMGRIAFMTTPMIQDATIRNLEIMGEATKHLTPDFRQTYPQVPWRTIAGLRDFMIHNYVNVDLDLIWDIVERDIPALKEQMVSILGELSIENDQT